ncbi:hypothetical protein VTH06DRAFT_8230 [Thermothelomyces fergusii]
MPRSLCSNCGEPKIYPAFPTLPPTRSQDLGLNKAERREERGGLGIHKALCASDEGKAGCHWLSTLFVQARSAQSILWLSPPARSLPFRSSIRSIVGLIFEHSTH